MKPDPRFPDRPAHPDFDRLSQAVIANDAVVTDAPTGAQQNAYAVHVSSIVDLASLKYMADQRTALALRSVNERGYDIEHVLPSAWIDGFMAAAHLFKPSVQDGQYRSYTAESKPPQYVPCSQCGAVGPHFCPGSR